MTARHPSLRHSGLDPESSPRSTARSGKPDRHRAYLTLDLDETCFVREPLDEELKELDRLMANKTDEQKASVMPWRNRVTAPRDRIARRQSPQRNAS